MLSRLPSSHDTAWYSDDDSCLAALPGAEVFWVDFGVKDLERAIEAGADLKWVTTAGTGVDGWPLAPAPLVRTRQCVHGLVGIRLPKPITVSLDESIMASHAACLTFVGDNTVEQVSAPQELGHTKSIWSSTRPPSSAGTRRTWDWTSGRSPDSPFLPGRPTARRCRFRNASPCRGRHSLISSAPHTPAAYW